MKEIALLGTGGKIYSHVLTALLENGNSVNVMVTEPEKVMLNTTNVTITRLDTSTKEATRRNLEGYDTVIVAYETDFQDAANNNFILRTYSPTVNAAIEAGVKHLIVVGARESEAFLHGELRRHKDLIDSAYISTEGNYSRAAVDAL